MPGRAWSLDEDAILLQLRMDGFEYAAFAGPVFDRTDHACMVRMGRLQRSKAGRRRKSWTDEDIAALFRLRDVAGMEFKAIDAKLGCRPGCSKVKYYMLKQSGDSRRQASQRDAVIAELFADRGQRQRLQYHSITAAFCGDPLPGRSALDQRSQGARPS